MTSSARRASIALVALGALTLGPADVQAEPQLELPGESQLEPPATPLLDGDPPPGWPVLPEVEVPIVLLLDGHTGQVLGARGAEERRPVASTIKVLTALSASLRSDDDEVVTVGEEVVGIEGSSVGLAPGDEWTVGELLEGLLARSGNDAAEALATHVAGDTAAFVALMADDAAALGLGTGAAGPTLDSASGLGDGNLLSAHDLAIIARAALADPQLRPVLAAPEVTLPGLGTVENRNLLLERYDGATGVKTGFTAAAGNSLVASAERDGRELVVVVLGADADPERFDAATALLDHGFDAFEAVALEPRIDLLVAGGRLTLSAEPAEVTVPAAAPVRVDLGPPIRPPEGSYEAPVEVGGEAVAAVELQPGTSSSGAASGDEVLGRAIVDGVYAGLRARSGVEVTR